MSARCSDEAFSCATGPARYLTGGGAVLIDDEQARCRAARTSVTAGRLRAHGNSAAGYRGAALASSLCESPSLPSHATYCAHGPACYGFAMVNSHLLLPVVIACTLVAGCRAKSTTEPDSAAPVVADDKDNDNNESSVSVDKSVSDMCNLPTPNFDYNSANLSGTATNTLDALAQCFIDGPGKGKTLLIVGHADPRGDEEYNFGLGQRRADTVVSYLTGRGLSQPQIESSSRGELDAVGTDEGGWRRDRRVEIGMTE